MTPLKIAFSGVHSTGKTTAVNALAERYSGTGMRVVRIPEIARSCPWPVNRAAGAEAQRWIFHRQMTAELEAAHEAAGDGGDSLILCDRTALDSLVYSKWHEERSRGGLGAKSWAWVPVIQHYFKAVCLPSYDAVFVTCLRGGAAEDGFRDTDTVWQQRIHLMFDSAWGEIRRQMELFGRTKPLILDYTTIEDAEREIDMLLPPGRRPPLRTAKKHA
ncbi:MAG: ATP-binding protein [Deltaproteobacteria bacterium]|nr:ATP-binding protein [Deltaproteobacteria bacterium]